MASKNVHIVSFTGTSVVPNDPSSAVHGGNIDVALALSEKYGVNIRQGNNFRMIGYGVQCAVPGQDTGAGIIANINFVEPNRHIVKAWNMVFNQWKKQKSIRAQVGESMRYDDFELCWDAGSANTRTSHIYDDPFSISDGDPQDVGLIGASSESGDYTSIADVYNSRFPAPQASSTHYGGALKDAKFGDYFIDQSTNVQTALTAQATATGGLADVSSLPTGDQLGWGVSIGEMTMLPADNHINVMCGLLNYSIRLFPEDTLSQLADTVQWRITLMFEGWSPLAASAKKRRKGAKK